MKTTFRKLTAQITAPEARFCPISGLPKNSTTATEVLRAYRAATKTSGPAFAETDVYCGYVLNSEIWFIHPRSCPAGLSRMARRHIGNVVHAKDLGHSLRSAVYNAIGFRRYRENQPSTPRTIVQRARCIDLAPQDSGIYGYSRALGIEIEGTSPYGHESLSDYLPYYTRVVSDASIRTILPNHSPAEVKILLNRATFDQRLTRVCKTLEAVGFSTNRSCGLHVHLDARHLDMETRKKMQRNMTKWLALLIELVPLSRRDNNYCKLDVRSGRYCAVSVQTNGKNTIEVRLHSATIDQTKITMWLRLLELIAVLPPPSPKLTTTLAGLESIPLCEWDKNYWRARHRLLNPGSYPDSNASTTENE